MYLSSCYTFLLYMLTCTERDREEGCEMKKNQKNSENHHNNIVNRGGGAWSRGVLYRGVFD